MITSKQQVRPRDKEKGNVIIIDEGKSNEINKFLDISIPNVEGTVLVEEGETFQDHISQLNEIVQQDK